MNFGERTRSFCEMILLSAVVVVGGIQASPTPSPLPTTTLFSTRLVGGEPALPGYFPYQVSIRRHNVHVCGGAIINARFIITAAVCVTTPTKNGTKFEIIKPTFLTAYVGSVYRQKGGQVKKVDQVIVHEKFSGIFNNLALLRLERMLIFSEDVKMITLAEFETPDDSEVIISGWGRLDELDEELPVMLHWDTVSSLSPYECFQSLLLSSNDLLCLAHETGHGSCHGDLGGPAVFEDDLVGVASFVSGRCASNRPDGYVKVLHHLDWITENSVF